MQNVISVRQLNTYIKNMFTQDYFLQMVSVKGEVSNCKYHPSGHIYFTLKDSASALNCIMFAGDRRGLGFRLTEGQQVIAKGSVSVFERDGRYQLYVKEVTQDGAGALYEKYEQLKRELAEEGMFAPEYKQQIPKYIHTLGVVTADTGAAVRDIIQIASRRNPYVQIILYPALVQGASAAPSIVNGIHALERQGVDVMIVGRGGGSIEDLWAFNERMVAQAVFDCSVPIISAVGHETDTTIIDYVADLRAPTPSAAAELAVTQVSDIENEILDRQDRLYQRMGRVLQHKRQQADQMEMRLKYLSPASRIREKRTYSIQLEDRLQNRLQAILRERRHNLALYIERMKAVSPLEKLNSGFSYVEDTDGKNIRSVTQVEAGERLRIRVSDGVIDTRVEQIQKEERLPG
ncbi:MAG: exodeoxyribonuclease VII large subunit [Waltera sp.]|uniref:exodeoxyribonuclease VII large subunit n=1 Tax=Waltera TaxID=2815781 RepID=UPI000E4FE7AF|nr:exodeoxyribonuclease VII large subunit [Clostridium sp. AF34-10BH]RHP38126.1 exodeoxyribonuclease VII large subunit [Clostridium sp. AF34-10BH]